MSATNKQDGNTARWTMSTGGWPTENWVAVVVLGSLALLIAIRMGFRGVNVPGVGGVNIG